MVSFDGGSASKVDGVTA